MAQSSYNLPTTSPSHPVMNIPDNYKVFDLTNGFDEKKLTQLVCANTWGIGGYLEKRNGMYVAPQYKNTRNIHMGIDIWAPYDEPVFSPFNGIIAYKDYHNEIGNYGGTIVTSHKLNDLSIFILFGHLSKESVQIASIHKKINAGEQIGQLGSWNENGNWPPHLHLQIGLEDPGKADMPGVVNQEYLETAKKLYPDPRNFLGDLY